MHRVGFFAAKAAPTGDADCLQFQLSTRQRSPKGWAIYHRYSAWFEPGADPANQVPRWMARASPVFAGAPAPTGIAPPVRN
ncbi:hypothetical protein DBB42_26200 [Pseudomonas plecoglossicida]|uniref:Uncharacterized protein n=1 Tax=Pseudomonas plecoglossicida TaxID=70775 RepID=A0A2R7UBW7_PSEDL|nr:hypothetical protein DBB42_26200 [Pseudomonas plecoglossicida]